jgi:hypothetical protein
MGDVSREAALECSPRRKPWVQVGNEQAPKGRKTSSHEYAEALRHPKRDEPTSQVCKSK